MRRGPVCALGKDRTLRLWIGAPPGAAVTVDGRPPAKPPEPLAGGLLLEQAVASGARELVVETRLGSERWASRLALEERDRSAWFEAASALLGAGDLAAARRRVEPRLTARSPIERGRALRVLARVDLASGRDEQGEEALRQAIAAHRLSGALSVEIWDATALAHRLTQRRDFAAARAVIAELPDPAGHADSASLSAYTEGTLAILVGDLRTGLRRLRAAMEHAARARLVSQHIAAGQLVARELHAVGRAGEAEALFAALEDAAREGLAPCDRALLRTNHAWAWLLAREAGAPAGDPRPLLTDVLRSFDEECTALVGRTEERVNARLNLAFDHLQTGEVDAARRWLAEARRLLPQPGAKLLLWQEDLEARLLLATGEARSALAVYGRLAERARGTESPEAAWRAAHGQARAHEALGEVPRALAAHAAAEELLARASLLVPMHEGRATFMAQREGATRRHLDLLLRAGRNAEALAVARRARSRTLRDLRLAVRLGSLPPVERAVWDRGMAAHLAAREELDRMAAESWRLPGGEARRALEQSGRRMHALRGDLEALLARLDPRAAGSGEPPPLAAGELLLAYHPLPEGWVGFAADEHGTVARRLGRLEDLVRKPPALAAQVLAPFAPQIRRARRVRVLPYGVLRGVDFHALPFGGEVLLAAKPVVYALDLPAGPATSARRRGRAVVVGDPAGDLPGARAEARRAGAALAAAQPDWTVERLLGRQATGPAVRRALAGSVLFHYAGHAVAAGWDSFLPLAGGGRLTVDDVLALRRSPAWVLLSGCETAASAEESAVESMGLAHAFLSAGAEAVVAAVRPLPDREARALVEAFYAELPRAASPAEALRRAQLARRGGSRSGAWASFRAFAP
ncbi:MAG TPA: CHAT domain-containing protein [Thermoanaerobaculia bacterium]